MVIAVPIHIGISERCKDGFECGRIFGRHHVLHNGKKGHAEHAHIAVAPVLRGNPGNSVANIFNGAGAKIVVDALGLTCPAYIHNDLGITAPGKKLAVASFHMAPLMGKCFW